MPYNVQFAFLGGGHHYFVRVIRVSDNGFPQESECISTSYNLPKAFTAKLNKKSYSRIFIFNIRGHDFLSHCGQWTSSSGKGGYLESSTTAISELAGLEPLRVANEEKGFDGSDMIVSFGPRLSSFFVDVTAPDPKLRRYKWSNLPEGLNDELQKNGTSEGAKGYGNIFEVMMNPDASGKNDDGWVILFGDGEKFAFGGSLPRRLKEVLVEAKAAKKGRFFRRKNNIIHRIYLNHQNPDEYLLLFGDGRCYASLHEDFQAELENALSIWARGNGLPNFAIEFTPSCQCSRGDQKRQNALYYSKRGAFHLAKGNVSLALGYLREAADEDEGNSAIREILAMAILAMRRERGPDQVLDTLIHQRAIQPRNLRPTRLLDHDNQDALFRDEYMWVLDEGYDLVKLEARLDEVQKAQLAIQNSEELNEWSYGQGVDQIHKKTYKSPVKELSDDDVYPEWHSDTRKSDARSEAEIHGGISIEQPIAIRSSNPSTLAGALEMDAKKVQDFLEMNFEAANREYKWLGELKTAGHTLEELAFVLWNRVHDAPWIFFEVQSEYPKNKISFTHHLLGCVHRNDHKSDSVAGHASDPNETLASITDKQSSFEKGDVRNLVCELCGIAGIIPISRDSKTWAGHVKFSCHNQMSSISYHMGFTGLYDIGGVLEKFCWAVGAAQMARLCCDIFTVMRRVNIPHELDIVEMCQIRSQLAAEFLSQFETLIEDRASQRNQIIRCQNTATQILDFLGVDQIFNLKGERNEASIDQALVNNLHIYTLAAQFLTLGLTSYLQAHIGPIRPFFLDAPQKCLCLHGIHGLEAPAKPYPTITAEVQNLICISNMIQDSVMVFRLSKSSETTSLPTTKIDLLAALEDLIDTWGPGQFFISPEKSPEDSIYGVGLGGGVIQAISDDLFHWKNSSTVVKDVRFFNQRSKTRIGAAVEVNSQCLADDEQRLVGSEEYLDPLGTWEPSWEPRERQVGFSSGQYANLQFNQTSVKWPGITLKVLELNRLDEFLLSFLNSPWGLQVSFCTGISRRVLLREMAADLLPVFVERMISIPPGWQDLLSKYSVLRVLQGSGQSL